MGIRRKAVAASIVLFMIFGISAYSINFDGKVEPIEWKNAEYHELFSYGDQTGCSINYAGVKIIFDRRNDRIDMLITASTKMISQDNDLIGVRLKINDGEAITLKRYESSYSKDKYFVQYGFYIIPENDFGAEISVSLKSSEAFKTLGVQVIDENGESSKYKTVDISEKVETTTQTTAAHTTASTTRGSTRKATTTAKRTTTRSSNSKTTTKATTKAPKTTEASSGSALSTRRTRSAFTNPNTTTAFSSKHAITTGANGYAVKKSNTSGKSYTVTQSRYASTRSSDKYTKASSVSGGGASFASEIYLDELITVRPSESSALSPAKKIGIGAVSVLVGSAMLFAAFASGYTPSKKPDKEKSDQAPDEPEE